MEEGQGRAIAYINGRPIARAYINHRSTKGDTMTFHWGTKDGDDFSPACGHQGGDDHALTTDPETTPLTCTDCLAMYAARGQGAGDDIAIVISPSYNWRLNEPFVSLTVDGKTYALAPSVITALGLALIQNAEWAINDGMLLKVLHHGIGMAPTQATHAAVMLRQQATAEAKGEVEKMNPTDLVFPKGKPS